MFLQKTKVIKVEFYNEMYVLFCMIFMHIVDDYYLQGWLANGKQKAWWKSIPNYSTKYKYDYIIALLMHSFSWTFCIMLPLAMSKNLVLDFGFYLFFAINVLTHAVIDNEKANKLTINLIQDQFIHIAQVLITFFVLK